ncbi:type II secretion system minor pseudopilin GspI [Niveibacterium sp. SC-1]|uniref:type II secretion system minor pseudopilin GspI n=1 Tax=Niveibacterium sp. SC-1 TaxID=3135646 RepID=UPI00311D9191
MKHHAGFTLLEVLVALTILAVALSAGFRAVSLATSGASDLRDRMLGEWVAQNRLAEHRALGEFLNPGHYEGDVQQGGRTFRWTEEVKPTPNALFRRIDVRVYEQGEESHALATMTGFLVAPLR